MKESLLLLPLLLLLSCDKDGALRIAIEDSPNADCLKSIFKKDTNFALVSAKKADILVSLDSNLNYKNAKNGNELKYMRQETILGDPGYCRCKAILRYEIGICDFAKKHASDLAKLSAEEWKLDSNANGKMSISADNSGLYFRRQSWISQILIIKNDSSIELSIRNGTYTPPSNEIDTIARHLAKLHERLHDSPGLEDIYLGNTMFIYFEHAPSFEYLAKIANISRKAGYSDIIYSPTPLSYDIEIGEIDMAKELLNLLYHQSRMLMFKEWYKEYKEGEIPKYFSSYMVNLMSLESDYLDWDFIYDFQEDGLGDSGAFDFETKSTEPVQIIARIKKFTSRKLEDVGEVLFSFEIENGKLKISDVETRGVSLRKTLEDKKAKNEN
jgi:hypothetical protein